jgi:HEAT repeat protein
MLSGLLAGTGAAVQGDDDSGTQAQEDEQLLRSRQIAVDGPGLLDYFRRQTLAAVDERRVRELARQLGDPTFRVREKAAAELIAQGPKALPLLREAAALGDLEGRRRADKCIQAIESRSAGELLAAAARQVRVRRPVGAWAVLLEYLPAARDPEVEEAVVEALWELVRQDKRVEPALAAALADPSPARRAAAALAVGRLGDAGQRARVRRLLADPHPVVRLRAAEALLTTQDRAALPALIDLLETAPLEVAGRAEDLLRDLAGGRSPDTPLEESLAARRKCQDAWQAWLQAHGAKVDLAGRAAGGPTASPARRAKTVSQLFLQAVLRKDLRALTKTVEAPFTMLGLEVYRTQKELDDKLRELLRENKGEVFTVKLVKVGRPKDYLEKVGDKLRDFFKGVPLAELHIVYVQVQEKQTRTEDVALFVRVRGSRARVIGIGEARPQKTDPARPAPSAAGTTRRGWAGLG